MNRPAEAASCIFLHEGAEESLQVGGQRAAAVVGLALHFALGASPCGLRRAALRAKPTGRKTRDPVGRASRGTSFLELPGAQIFKGNSRKNQKEDETKKGDISIEVRKGTFLKSFDIRQFGSLTWHISHSPQKLRCLRQLELRQREIQAWWLST